MSRFESLKRFLFIAISTLLGTAPAQAQEVQPIQHPMLWKIEVEPPSWLFGTIHIGDPRVLALSETVEDALYDCEALYTELPMDGGLMSGMARHMFLPSDRTLKDVVPAALHQRLTAYLERRGQAGMAMMMEKMQVWGVLLTLGTLDFLDEMAAGQPLDGWLYDEGGSMGMEVGGLETMEEQVGVFTAFTLEEQIHLLGVTMDGLEKSEGEDQSEPLIRAYLEGRADEIMDVMEDEELDQDPLYVRLTERLLDDRNRRMVDRIAVKLARTPRKGHFFAVGTAHMPGENGMVQLLRDKGFTVTRINPPPPREDDEAAQDGDSGDLRQAVESLRDEVSNLRKRLEKVEKQLEGQRWQ